MDIAGELHAISNKRQVVLWGLEADTDEADKIKAKRAFDEVTGVLNAISAYVNEKKKCKNKGCPHYALGQENGCTVYEFISICVDSRKGA